MITNEQVEAALKAWNEADDAGNFAAMYAALKAADLEAAARIAELEAALDKADAALSWMLIEGCDEAIPETCPIEHKTCVDALADLRAARAAYRGKI